MKGWFTQRVAVILVASCVAFFILNYFMVPQPVFPIRKVSPYTYLVITVIWTLGLYIIRWQYNNLTQPPSPHRKFNFKSYLANMGKHQNPNSEGQTLGELASNQPVSMDMDEKDPGHSSVNPERNNGPGTSALGNVVEGVLAQSMADAELDMKLELPQGTKLEVFGQEVTVTKGKITLRPKRTQKQRLEQMFDPSKTRKRRA